MKKKNRRLVLNWIGLNRVVLDNINIACFSPPTSSSSSSSSSLPLVTNVEPADDQQRRRRDSQSPRGAREPSPRGPKGPRRKPRDQRDSSPELLVSSVLREGLAHRKALGRPALRRTTCYLQGSFSRIGLPSRSLCSPVLPSFS